MSTIDREVRITIRPSDLTERLKALLSRASQLPCVTILQAPEGIKYGFPFPVVHVDYKDGLRTRYFGEEASAFIEALTVGLL